MGIKSWGMPDLDILAVYTSLHVYKLGGYIMHFILTICINHNHIQSILNATEGYLGQESHFYYKCIEATFQGKFLIISKVQKGFSIVYL